MPVMEKVLTVPEVHAPVNYYDKRTVTATTFRWVWFPGDLIIPQRKAEISWLKAGGEETPSPCLQRYGRGFVPRGRAALLELGGEPVPMKHLGDLQAVAWQGISFSGEAAKNNFGFVPVFPGDGLKVLKRYAMNPVRKGMDEITGLIGKSWEECHDEDGTGILDFIEQAQFGDGLEPTLRGLENQIRHAVVKDTRIDYGKMKSEQLAMCEDFRNWGMRMVAVEHGLLKTGHVGEWQGGWSYAYSPMCEMLMDQLEVTRQDQPMHEMAKLIEKVIPQPQAPSMSAEEIGRMMDERLAKAREADARKIAELEAKLNGTALADPWDGSPVIPGDPKYPIARTFHCSKCGQECASKAGQMAHERFCKGVVSE